MKDPFCFVWFVAVEQPPAIVGLVSRSLFVGLLLLFCCGDYPVVDSVSITSIFFAFGFVHWKWCLIAAFGISENAKVNAKRNFGIVVAAAGTSKILFVAYFEFVY